MAKGITPSVAQTLRAPRQNAVTPLLGFRSRGLDTSIREKDQPYWLLPFS